MLCMDGLGQEGLPPQQLATAIKWLSWATHLQSLRLLELCEGFAESFGNMGDVSTLCEAEREEGESVETMLGRALLELGRLALNGDE